MLEANPSLTPRRVRELLVLACRRVEGAPGERQGAGAIDAGAALALAIADVSDVAHPAVAAATPGKRLRFVVHEPDAADVKIVGSWDGWNSAGANAARVTAGLWIVTLPALSPGTYAYKFVFDGTRWTADTMNRSQESDGFGGSNSTFVIR
jgi:hypothetical protein